MGTVGWGLLYQRKRLPMCFFPVMFVSGISTVLYLFGLAGQLKIASYGLVLLGVLWLLLYAKKEALRGFVLDPSILFVCIGIVWLFVITRGTMLSHWDDGSHWYRVCKSVYYENAYPTTPDILYYDYVPGCQTWVYFILRYTGFSIPNCLFAQSIINVACTAVLFAGIDGIAEFRSKVYATGIIIVASVVICCIVPSTYTLMVDLQVGLAAMAALVFVIQYGERAESLVPGMMLSSFLVLIKNTGLLFAAVVLCWEIRRYRVKGKRRYIYIAAWGIVPLLLFVCYILRSAWYYADGVSSPQSLSVSRFLAMIGEKTPEVIARMTYNFIYQVFIGDTGIPLTACVSFGILFLLRYILCKEGYEQEALSAKTEILGILRMLGMYLIILYATYLFAMSAGEAYVLSSFYRYYGTGVVVVTGVAVCLGIKYTGIVTMTKNETTKKCLWGMLFFAVLSMRGCGSPKYILGQEHYVIPENYHPSLWQAMEYYVPEGKRYTEDSYILLWDKEDFGGDFLNENRIGFAAGAWLRSTDILVISRNEIENGLDINVLLSLPTYDYLICMSDMSCESEILAPYLNTNDFSVGTRSIE